MNLDFLPYGTQGVVYAALIALVGSFLIFGLVHFISRKHHGMDAKKIGWAWLVSVAITAGIDTWNLFYMGITPMQSPVLIARTLDAVHDPDTLGLRVVCEIIAASVGVVLGWLLWAKPWKREMLLTDE